MEKVPDDKEIISQPQIDEKAYANAAALINKFRGLPNLKLHDHRVSASWRTGETTFVLMPSLSERSYLATRLVLHGEQIDLTMYAFVINKSADATNAPLKVSEIVKVIGTVPDIHNPLTEDDVEYFSSCLPLVTADAILCEPDCPAHQ